MNLNGLPVHRNIFHSHGAGIPGYPHNVHPKDWMDIGSVNENTTILPVTLNPNISQKLKK